MLILRKNYQVHTNFDGMYVKPRINRDLIKENAAGLICLSSCIAGELCSYILNDDMEKAKETAKWYKDIFGDDYYIELQDHNIPEQKKTTISLKDNVPYENLISLRETISKYKGKFEFVKPKPNNSKYPRRREKKEEDNQNDVQYKEIAPVILENNNIKILAYPTFWVELSDEFISEITQNHKDFIDLKIFSLESIEKYEEQQAEVEHE